MNSEHRIFNDPPGMFVRWEPDERHDPEGPGEVEWGVALPGQPERVIESEGYASPPDGLDYQRRDAWAWYDEHGESLSGRSVAAGVTTTIESPLLLVVYANATTASIMFTVPAGERTRLDIYEDQIAHVGNRRLEFERFDGPPAPGLWIFDGDAIEDTEQATATSTCGFTGTWRRPTVDEVSHIAAGTWPGVQVGA